MPHGLPDGRLPALDAARGIAVACMVYLHLVSTDLPGGFSLLGQFLEGKAATLFFLLAGMTWRLQRTRSPLSIVKRAGALGSIGLLLHVTVWPTEVLVPLAFAMVLTRIFSDHVVFGDMLACLCAALTLVIPIVFAGITGSDWMEDGSHIADHGLSFATLRWLLIDGNYPLVPWWAYTWLGFRSVVWALSAPKTTHTGLTAGFLMMVVGYCIPLLVKLTPASFHPVFISTWTPTTLAFACASLGSAIVVVLACGATNVKWFPLVAMGRLSLSHYVTHILLVFVPLRTMWPDESWPINIGLLCFIVWLCVALTVSPLWLTKTKRGPLEALWHRVSGA